MLKVNNGAPEQGAVARSRTPAGAAGDDRSGG